ncbi:dTDP-4-dehydrorhamnose reductase [Magnetococcus marinus MC-1]|uniref:dTDP-4-dehydrorhamnose reductase n=1 Tax=Magnetococcus marinus (strain ATCC BAA-1437 / JCM 17883 / MC-1) TaxID=156889 RepID=A0L9I2_MAGMM|nr:dTDP-4-dehydrorhamnose reductase [Magnetococcus marinus]ABK44625.1 dTDP-4-dehydrorhamnose reductase [Magnetococcus marinus MC-1]
MHMQTVWITGAQGQMARALYQQTPPGCAVRCFGRQQWDLSQPAKLELPRQNLPQLLIHTAAMTDVDGAEKDPHLAFALNGTATERLAQWCADYGIAMLALSTDYLFDGQATRPYRPDDRVNPLSVYGRSKQVGEQAIQEILGDQAAIIRTAWLYDGGSGRNFLTTMLRLMGQGTTPLRIVEDQWGAPTACDALARVVWALAQQLLDQAHGGGLYHWSCQGQSSWFEFAQTIQQIALEMGLLQHPVELQPISAVQYGAPAPRPAYSVLDSTLLVQRLGTVAQPPPWQQALRAVMQAMPPLK